MCVCYLLSTLATATFSVHTQEISDLLGSWQKLMESFFVFLKSSKKSLVVHQHNASKTVHSYSLSARIFLASQILKKIHENFL